MKRSRWKGAKNNMWNIIAKLFEEFTRKIDPCKDLVFADSRKARKVKRK